MRRNACSKVIPACGCVLILILVLLAHGCNLHSGRLLRQTGEERKEIAAGARLLDKGRKDSALKAFDRAVALAPSEIETYLAVANLLMRAKAYEESIPYLTRAVALPPKGKSGYDLMIDKLWDSGLYTALGDAYYHLRKVGEAERAFRQAVLLDKNNAAAYNDWGYMYADLGIKTDEALRLTRRAVEIEPRNGYFVDSVGWAHFRNGETEKALTYLKRAVELAPSEPEIRYHLGRVYEAVGNRSGALVEYRKGLFLSPGHKPSQERADYLRRTRARKK